jgi:hypothetical protein
MRFPLAMLVLSVTACEPQINAVDESVWAAATAAPRSPDATYAAPIIPPRAPQPQPMPPAEYKLQSDVGSWVLSGFTSAAGQIYQATAGFDFAAKIPLRASVELPVTLPPETQNAKSITATYKLAAAPQWATESCANGYRVMSSDDPNTVACVPAAFLLTLKIDGIDVASWEPGQPGTLSAQSPLGVSYPVNGDLSLVIGVQGSVDLSAISGEIDLVAQF